MSAILGGYMRIFLWYVFDNLKSCIMNQIMQKVHY